MAQSFEVRVYSLQQNVADLQNAVKTNADASNKIQEMLADLERRVTATTRFLERRNRGSHATLFDDKHFKLLGESMHMLPPIDDHVTIGVDYVPLTYEKGVEAGQAHKLHEWKPFVEWSRHIANHHMQIKMKNVHIQSMDMFGPRIGFAKFECTCSVQLEGRTLLEDQKYISFMRGGAVSVLVILTHRSSKYALVVRQPRVPVCISSLLEIPAGMLDGNGHFSGVAAKELKEETSIQISERELVDMTELTHHNRYPGMYPSPEGTDEFNRLYLYSKTIEDEEFSDLNGKLTGVEKEGEMIRLEIIPLDALWRRSADAKALGSLTLYDKLVTDGYLPGDLAEGLPGWGYRLLGSWSDIENKTPWEIRRRGNYLRISWTHGEAVALLHLDENGGGYEGEVLGAQGDVGKTTWEETRVELDDDGTVYTLFRNRGKAWGKPREMERITNSKSIPGLPAACDKYQKPRSLFDALRHDDHILIQGTWLIERSGQKDLVPHRKELPRAASWRCEDLEKRILVYGDVQFVAISYAWHTPSHPDPNGTQLEVIAKALRHRQDLKFHDGSPVFHDCAVFWDWCSMFQKPRADEEQKCFERALKSVNLWYCHQNVDVWFLTKSLEGHIGVPFHHRGWPTFERGISSLVSPFHALLDLGQLSDKQTCWQETWSVCKAGRLPPMVPEEFWKKLDTKTFTNSADVEMVKKKYEKTFKEVTEDTEVLHYSFAKWGDDEARQFTQVLPMCRRLKSLYLRNNHIKAAGAKALGDTLQACKSLEILRLDDNRTLTVEGGCALVDGAMKSSLKRLGLFNCFGEGNCNIKGTDAETLFEKWREAAGDRVLFI